MPVAELNKLEIDLLNSLDFGMGVTAIEITGTYEILYNQCLKDQQLSKNVGFKEVQRLQRMANYYRNEANKSIATQSSFSRSTSIPSLGNLSTKKPSAATTTTPMYQQQQQSSSSFMPIFPYNNSKNAIEPTLTNSTNDNRSKDNILAINPIHLPPTPLTSVESSPITFYNQQQFKQVQRLQQKQQHQQQIQVQQQQ